MIRNTKSGGVSYNSLPANKKHEHRRLSAEELQKKISGYFRYTQDHHHFIKGYLTYNKHVRYVLRNKENENLPVADRYRGGGFFRGYIMEDGVKIGMYLVANIKENNRFRVIFNDVEIFYVKAEANELYLLSQLRRSERS